MWGRRSAGSLLLAALLGATILGVSAARARVAGSGILNQTTIPDPTGDSADGPDVSSLTVTTYGDSTVSFAVALANRDLLRPEETAQVLVDLNDDGTEDLDLSIWADGQPSYLDKWSGTDWTDVRQIAIAQTAGSFSVRMSLADLRDAAGVRVGSAIGVLVMSGVVVDTKTGRVGVRDELPNDGSWIQHDIQAPPAPATTSTTRQTTTTPAPTAPATPRTALGKSVLLGRRTRTHGCTPGQRPDRRCSPGAYYAKLTRAVICSPGFRASELPGLSAAAERRVEREYGLAAGRAERIDRVVGVELGGSNAVANLFPEKADHARDRLETKLHRLVCSGAMTLRAARRGVAADWEKLYEKVFGARPAAG